MTPELQTVLTVVGGRSLLGARKFKWGEAVPQVSVGLQGDWVVSGSGVQPVHLLLTFDGRQVHAASVRGADPVYLQDTPINDSWNPIPVGSELRFGEARISVSCQPVEDGKQAAWTPAEHPSGPPEPPLAEHRAHESNTQLIADYREELERQRHGTSPPPRAGAPFQAEAPPLRVLTSANPANRAPEPTDTSAAPPVQPQATPLHGLGGTLPLAPERSSPPTGGGSIGVPRAAAAATGPVAADLSATVQLAPGPAAVLPEPGPGYDTMKLRPEAARSVSDGPERLQQTVATTNQPAAEGPQLGIETVHSQSVSGPMGSQAGAEGAAAANAVGPAVFATLDAPAKVAAPTAPDARAANMTSATVGSPQSTEAPVSTLSDGGALRQLAAQLPPSPPDPVPRSSLQQSVAAGGAPPEPAQTTPPDVMAAYGARPSTLSAPDFKEPGGTSLIKKLTLALLPVAGGLFAYSLMFPQEPTQANTAGTPGSASARAVAGAKPKSLPVAENAPPAKAAPGAQSAPTPTDQASATAKTPPEAADTADTADTASSNVAAMLSKPENAKASRAALDAAFEGRLVEAGAQYSALAKATEHPLYALAAQHLEQGSVRAP